jgi:hypothetical protein
MSRNKDIAVTVFTILVIFWPGYIVNGQGKSRPKIRPRPPATSPAPAKLPVIVNFKDGESVKGHFIRADADNLQVEVRSGKLSIKMSDVFSLIFERDDEETPSKSVEEVVKNLDQGEADSPPPVARKAYNTLRRLAEAGKLRVPYSQYSAQLFEAKTVVDEALGALPDGAIKIDLTRALEVFTDVASAWGAASRNGRISIKTEPGSTLMEKYNIKPELNAVADADHLKLDTALKTILSAAEPMLRNIAFITGW